MDLGSCDPSQFLKPPEILADPPTATPPSPNLHNVLPHSLPSSQHNTPTQLPNLNNSSYYSPTIQQNTPTILQNMSNFSSHSSHASQYNTPLHNLNASFPTGQYNTPTHKTTNTNNVKQTIDRST